jgi:hypothetical protein
MRRSSDQQKPATFNLYGAMGTNIKTPVFSVVPGLDPEKAVDEARVMARIAQRLAKLAADDGGTEAADQPSLAWAALFFTTCVAALLDSAERP